MPADAARVHRHRDGREVGALGDQLRAEGGAAVGEAAFSPEAMGMEDLLVT